MNDFGQSKIGSGGIRLIILNQIRLSTIPPLLQVFVYAHECGHHLSGDIVSSTFYLHDTPLREQNADRIGIRLMRDQLHITKSQADSIASMFVGNPGLAPYYLPGPLRAAWISACYSTSDNPCGATAIIYKKVARDDQVGTNTEPSSDVMCDLISKYFENAPEGILSERGAQIDKNTWKSKLHHPNSSCTISYREKEMWHAIHCEYPQDTASSAFQFINARVKDVRSCLKKAGLDDKFEETTHRGANGTTTVFAREVNDEQTFRMSLGAFVDSGPNNGPWAVIGFMYIGP